MSALLDHLLRLAAADWVPWLLSGAIIAAALLLWTAFSRRALRLRRSLDEAKQQLALTPERAAELMAQLRRAETM